MAVSTAQATAMLGALPGTSYVQLHSGDPGAAGTSNVLAGPGRSAVTLPAASSGQRAAGAVVDVASVPQGAVVSHVTYWDAVSGGSFLYSQALASSVTFAYAGRLRFASQVFTISTGTSGSQAVPSVNADTASASDTATGRLTVRVSDTATTADTAICGAAVVDSSSLADSNVIRLAVVTTDSSSTSDTAIGTQGGGTTYVSDVTDAATGGDDHALTQVFRDVSTDTSSTGDSNTAENVAAGDTVAPVVTAFTLGTPSGLTVKAATLSADEPSTFVLLLDGQTPDAGSNWQADTYWTTTDGYTGSAGAITLRAWARDAAGNISLVENTLTATCTLTNPDTTAPTIVSFTVSPSNPSSPLTGITVSFHATDSGNGIRRWVVHDVPGGSAAPTFTAFQMANAFGAQYVDPTSADLTVTSAAWVASGRGARDVYLGVMDADGNIAVSSKVTITISGTDTAGPTLTSHDIPSSCDSGFRTLSLTLTDTGGGTPKKYRAFVVGRGAEISWRNSSFPDGTVISGTNNPVTVSATNMQFQSGERDVYVYAADGNQNVRLSGPIPVTVT